MIKPELGQFTKRGLKPYRTLHEFRVTDSSQYQVGQDITIDTIKDMKWVDVQGVSKGKGFQGVMKRHHFHGMPASHGCSKRHRAPGGLGRQNSINKGVPKGKKMAGHMGSDTVTAQALQIIRIDTENNILLVKGCVPGAAGSAADGAVATGA